MTITGRLRERLAGVLAVVAVLLAVVATPARAQPSDPMPSFNGTVLTLAYAGSTLYLGGDFTAAIVNGKPVARSHLAAVDARTGGLLAWAPASVGLVSALTVAGTAVYVAGDFAHVDGTSRRNLARLDAVSGALAAGFQHRFTGSPLALAAANGRLYVGGNFTAVDGRARVRLAAFSLTTGALDAAWHPSADAAVAALAAAPGRIYAGGKFRKVNGLTGYERLVAFDPVGAKVVTGFVPRAAVIVLGITVTADTVYTAHGGQGGLVSAYASTGLRRWAATFDGDARAVTVLNGVVYAGGHFDRACRTARTGARGVCLDGSDDRVKLAALDSFDGHLLDWSADANGVEGVLTLAANPALGTIALGGAFTSVGGLTQKRLAQLH